MWMSRHCSCFAVSPARQEIATGAEADALPTDREPRHRREHAQRRPGQPGRVGRLALPAAVRLAQLVRRVRVVRGRLPLEVECRPAFDYARARHATEVSEHGARFDGPGLSLGLAASVPLRADNGGAVAAFPLGEGQSATFVLRAIAPDAHPGRCPGTEEAEGWFRETVAYWQRWAAQCTYRGRWRE